MAQTLSVAAAAADVVIAAVVVILAVFVNVVVAAAPPPPSETITEVYGDTGTFLSPNYPNKYPTGMTVNYTGFLDTHGPVVVRLYMDYDIEGSTSHCVDYIKIQGTYICTRNVEIRDFVVLGSELFMHFYSDVLVGKPGFNITYQVLGPASVSITSQNANTETTSLSTSTSSSTNDATSADVTSVVATGVSDTVTPSTLTSDDTSRAEMTSDIESSTLGLLTDSSEMSTNTFSPTGSTETGVITTNTTSTTTTPTTTATPTTTTPTATPTTTNTITPTTTPPTATISSDNISTPTTSPNLTTSNSTLATATTNNLTADVTTTTSTPTTTETTSATLETSVRTDTSTTYNVHNATSSPNLPTNTSMTPPHQTSNDVTDFTANAVSSLPTTLNSNEASAGNCVSTSSPNKRVVTSLAMTLPQTCRCMCCVSNKTLASVSEEMRRLLASLKLDKMSLSSTRRRRTSMHDHRQSARTLGALGAVVCSLPLIVVIAFDVIKFCAVRK